MRAEPCLIEEDADPREGPGRNACDQGVRCPSSLTTDPQERDHARGCRSSEQFSRAPKWSKSPSAGVQISRNSEIDPSAGRKFPLR